MSTVNVNRVVDASGGVLAPISSVMRNRLINSAMTIDQRNAGASVTPASGAVTYTLDRWAFYVNQASKLTVQQTTVVPTGFTNSLAVTSSSAYSSGSSDIFVMFQSIEGFNTADLGWGTANAATITLSFWTRSSLTGTHSGSLTNNGNARSYPFSYTIVAANTWEYKTITIAGDTSGTWLTNNGVGIAVKFNLGCGSSTLGTAGSWQSGERNGTTGSVSVVGTSGATWYVTGCQIERGTQATSFEYRQYQQELALCQRYFQIVALNIYNGNPGAGEFHSVPVAYLTQMRAAPTAGTISGGTSTNTVFVGLENLTAYGCRFTISSNTSADTGYVGGQAPLSVEL